MGETVSDNTDDRAPGDPTTHPSGHELDASPWLRVESTIMATARLMREAYDDALAHLDLNLTEASLLAYVVESGPLKQTSIADHLGIGRAAAGNVIDRLEHRDLVTRSSDATDRRVWLVEATPAGIDLAGRVTDVDVQLRRGLRRGINRDERQLLADLLVRLQRNLIAQRATARTSDHPPSIQPSPSTVQQ